MFENPKRGRQAKNFTTSVPKILDLKSSSEQIFSRKLSLGAPDLKRAARSRHCQLFPFVCGPLQLFFSCYYILGCPTEKTICLFLEKVNYRHFQKHDVERNWDYHVIIPWNSVANIPGKSAKNANIIRTISKHAFFLPHFQDPSKQCPKRAVKM